MIDSKSAKLEEYELPPELQQMEEELRVFVSDVAMEDILRLTDEMCGKTVLEIGACRIRDKGEDKMEEKQEILVVAEKTVFLQNRSTCKRDRNYPLKMQSEVISSRLDTPHIFMVSSSSDPIFSM